MVRHFARKTEHSSTSLQVMQDASDLVVNQNKSLRESA